MRQNLFSNNRFEGLRFATSPPSLTLNAGKIGRECGRTSLSIFRIQDDLGAPHSQELENEGIKLISGVKRIIRVKSLCLLGQHEIFGAIAVIRQVN